MRQLEFREMAENRESFFARIHQFIKPYHKEAVAIACAYDDCKREFDETFRVGGERYFEHPRVVALILMDAGVQDPDVVKAALAHDHREDRKWSRRKVARKYGATTAFIVEGVTMPEGEFPDRETRMRAYHKKFEWHMKRDIRVLLVKLADRLHNLRTCKALSRNAQVRMVEETEAFYLPLARQHNFLYRELEEVIVCVREHLRKGEKRLSV